MPPSPSSATIRYGPNCGCSTLSSLARHEAMFLARREAGERLRAAAGPVHDGFHRSGFRAQAEVQHRAGAGLEAVAARAVARPLAVRALHGHDRADRVAVHRLAVALELELDPRARRAAAVAVGQ